MKRHQHYLALGVMWIAAAIVFALVWHLVAPEFWHFMTAEQQRTRETIATAIVSAAAANYLRDLYGPGRAGPG